MPISENVTQIMKFLREDNEQLKAELAERDNEIGRLKIGLEKLTKACEKIKESREINRAVCDALKERIDGAVRGICRFDALGYLQAVEMETPGKISRDEQEVSVRILRESENEDQLQEGEPEPDVIKLDTVVAGKEKVVLTMSHDAWAEIQRRINRTTISFRCSKCRKPGTRFLQDM